MDKWNIYNGSTNECLQAVSLPYIINTKFIKLPPLNTQMLRRKMSSSFLPPTLKVMKKMNDLRHFFQETGSFRHILKVLGLSYNITKSYCGHWYSKLRKSNFVDSTSRWWTIKASMHLYKKSAATICTVTLIDLTFYGSPSWIVLKHFQDHAGKSGLLLSTLHHFGKAENRISVCKTVHLSCTLTSL